MNVNITSQKTGALHIGFKPQNGDFLENGSNDLRLTSVNCGDRMPK
jgi:hypothetical protein